MPKIIDRSVFDYGGKTLVSLAPDNNTLCVVNKSGLCKVLQINKPEEEPEVLETANNVTSVRCDSNSSYLLSTLQGDAYRYDLKTSSSQLLARSALAIRDCSVVHAGKIGVFGGDDLELLLIELDDENLKKHSIKLDEQISQMSYAPRTNMLSISFINGNIQFFSLSSARPNKVHELTGYIPANSYKDTNGENISAKLGNDLHNDDGEGDEEDEEEERVTDPEFCDENRVCTRAAWHPSGLYFALPCDDFTIKIFNIKGYTLVKTLRNAAILKDSFIELQFEPLHGNYIASMDLNNRLVIWNWHTSEITYKREFKQKVTNLVWKAQSNSKNLDIIMGTWSGGIINVQDVAESLSAITQGMEDSSNTENLKTSSLFVDSDFDDSESDAYNRDPKDIDADGKSKDTGDISTNNEGDLKQGKENDKRKYHFDEEDDFIDDDDGAGYVSVKKSRHSHQDNNGIGINSKPRETTSMEFRYKPISSGATPFGKGDRRYLTMNNVGYVCVVNSNDQNSITVSFFDIGRFREYHFEDVFGYDVCCLNEIGTLFGQSKTGQLHYRSHNLLHANWTKTLPLQNGERITSVAATPRRVFVGTSFGYMRIFNQYGVPLMVEKMSPVVALAAQDYKVFAVHYSPYHGISYSLFEQSPTMSKYYQRESPLPIAIPQDHPYIDGDFDKNFARFNPMGIKSLFFSAYGDPCIFGNDNVLLILSKWRSTMESRWLPVLDTNTEVWKMSGGKSTSLVHVWPLGLTYDTLNCIFVKGKNIWPEFPLPLPSEMEIRIPILVKSKILEGQKRVKAIQEEQNEDASFNEEKENLEIVVPVQMAAEEEFLRSKVLSSLLNDSLENDGELYGNENEIISSLTGAHDKSLLRLFAAACADQRTDMALSLAEELKQDRALLAAVKISERAELLTLIKRVNEIREARFEQQLNTV